MAQKTALNERNRSISEEVLVHERPIRKAATNHGISPVTARTALHSFCFAASPERYKEGVREFVFGGSIRRPPSLAYLRANASLFVPDKQHLHRQKPSYEDYRALCEIARHRCNHAQLERALDAAAYGEPFRHLLGDLVPPNPEED